MVAHSTLISQHNINTMKTLKSITKNIKNNKSNILPKTYAIFASVDPTDLFMGNFTELLSDACLYETEQKAMDDGAIYVVKLEVTSIKKVETTSKLVNSTIEDFQNLEDNNF